jgi:hypothetical protein
VNIFQRRFLIFMSHERLQGRNAHVFVGLVGAERMPEGMHTHLFADPSFFDVFGDDRFDGRNV